jgi:hypothetical protein
MKNIYLFASLFIFQSLVFSQQNKFNINLYKDFLNSHQNMDAGQLLDMHSAGSFESKTNIDISSALYLDSVSIKYNLTDYEKSLLNKNGFVVTERLKYGNFKDALKDIYNKDLPVFVSTDAILNAFHLSYDRILKDVELGFLIDKLTNMLNNIDNNLSQLDSKYAGDDSMRQALKDVDVYLTVPRKLLDESSTPYYADNSEKINHILNEISSEQGNVTDTLFSRHCVVLDWSQFKTRGHYTDQNHPILAKYFKAMMWLGRINLILLDSKSAPIECPPQDFYDLKRQTLMTFLISELFDVSNEKQDYQQIEDVLEFFVGKQDNVTLDNINSLKEKLNINSADQLVDSLKLVEFQDSLKTQSFANQMILSQILFSYDVTEPDSIIPPSAFRLFGQRFVIDSYVTGSVVYERIRYNGTVPCRLFPSVLDPLFALSNDAAAQLLQDELKKWHYSTNLGALRYLIDSYSDDFWSQSLYNMWLNIIRKLNTPSDRKSLPEFMQTAAYWQEKINTQLASWAELRHDNLLYAKQSYTGGTICSYPYSYVEPFPEFYKSLKMLAQTAKNKFQELNFSNQFFKDKLNNYFDNLYTTSDTLMQISEKELGGTSLTDNEKYFLKSMIQVDNGPCAPPLMGWYINLLYFDSEYQDENKYVVADIHTIPTDCGGVPYGWVMHAGTGPINLAVFTAKLPDNQLMSFVGPVSSFYEYTTTNFLRLTDEEWNDTYLQSAARPDFVNLYLANNTGESRGAGLSLVTSVKDDQNNKIIPVKKLLARNYPNPFNPSTIISYSIPYSLSNNKVKLIIYDIKGSIIKVLVDDILPAGNYLTRWDGCNEEGNKVSSGIYVYNLRVGDQNVSGKMTLLK